MELNFDEIKKGFLSYQINRGAIPRYLCKFRAIDKNCLCGIASNSLWFSSLDAFNDPFEGKIHFSKELKESTLPMIGLSASKDNIDSLDRMVEDWLNRLHFSQSVCCFSDSENDILLWSHYAHWHTGICLKFDLMNDLDFFSPVFPVSYDPEMKQSDNMNDFLWHLFQRKYKEWEYEKEYRVLSSMEPGSRNYDSTALVEVIFGCKTEISDKTLIQSILGKNVKYKQCQLNKEEFKLDIVEAVF